MTAFIVCLDIFVRYLLFLSKTESQKAVLLLCQKEECSELKETARHFFSLGNDIFGGVKMALPRVAARIL
jgi:hypothetical protein